MSDLQVITSQGGEAVLEEATIEEFRTTLRGDLITPSDERIDAAMQAEAQRRWVMLDELL